MSAWTLWLAVVVGCAVCSVGGALALPLLIPRHRPSAWVWIRSAILLVATPAVGIAVGALSGWDALRDADEDIQLAIARVDHDLLQRAMAAITGIGDITATGFLAILIGATLGYHQRSVRLLAVPFVAYWLSLRAQRFVDAVDGRPRPDDALAIGPVGGYPSGGTMRAMIVVGILAIVLAQFWRTRRELVGLGAIWGLLSWLEIASRSVLGRHWPLDLIGGAVMSLLLLGAVAPLLRLRTAAADEGLPVPSASAARAVDRSPGARSPGARSPRDRSPVGASVADEQLVDQAAEPKSDIRS